MLPAASFAVHVIAVVPIGNADGALLDIDSTPTASVAFAFPTDTALSFTLVASIVMSFGMINFGAVVSLTSTVWVELAELPAVSTAIHVTVVKPMPNTLGALLVTVTCSRSVTVGVPSGTVLLSSDVASNVMSFGGVIFGAVVSTTSTV